MAILGIVIDVLEDVKNEDAVNVNRTFLNWNKEIVSDVGTTVKDGLDIIVYRKVNVIVGLSVDFNVRINGVDNFYGRINNRTTI